MASHNRLNTGSAHCVELSISFPQNPSKALLVVDRNHSVMATRPIELPHWVLELTNIIIQELVKRCRIMTRERSCTEHEAGDPELGLISALCM